MKRVVSGWFASLGRSAGGWVALTIAASLLVCASVVGLHLLQERSLSSATAIVRDLRLARIDLYQGVTHSLLGQQLDSPWDPERGRVLIRQALHEFRSSLQRIPDGPATAALEVQIEEFGRALEAVRRKDPRAQLDLRVAFYRLNAAALQVDQQARNALVELQRVQNEAYWLVLSLAVVSLGLVSAAAVRLRLREAAAGAARDESERRLRESLALLRTREHELELRVQQRTADLAAANADLQTFSDAVSHDLRAPLAAVDTFAQTVLGKYGEGLAPQARHYLERVVAGAQNMKDMIEGLLELSRHARAPVHRRPLDLTGMARAAFELQAQALAGRRVAFVVDEGLQASGDPVLVATLLQNLIGNAVKYARERDPAHIEVGAREEAGERRFYVRDNGAGFDPAYADRLFKPFSRLHGADEFEGHGIGLATVGRIVARHGGRIWAEGAEGQGATFWFTLG